MTATDYEREYEINRMTRAPQPDHHPRWARRLGVFEISRDMIRANWGEFSFGRWGIGLELNAHEDRTHLRVQLPLITAYLYLPFMRWFATDDVNNQPSYGFSWTWERGSAIHLHWGRRCKVVWMPWGYHGCANQFMAEDGRWLDRDQKAASWRPGEGVEPLKMAYPYHYMLDDGEVQHVTATLVCERHKVVWHWGFGRWVTKALQDLQGHIVRWRYTIDISFSEEVGGRRGSWKGGCVGCAYDMKPGETPRQTLQRMQRERRFR